jgi:hypothetical protein
MTYFLGRDCNVFVTTESTTNNNGGTAAAIIVSGDEVAFQAAASAASGACIPPLTIGDAAKGQINDVTGIDLSISVSDEDVGPFLGKPQIMQKVELRKETVVTITRKKSNNFFDVLFNGPANAGDFIVGAPNNKRMGARFGVQYTGSTGAKIADGAKWMGDTDDVAGGVNCCYGYRLHLRLKQYDSVSTEEVFTVRNAVITGHTVTLNADGVTEETIEFTSSVAPTPFTPTAAQPSSGWIDVTMTPLSEL